MTTETKTKERPILFSGPMVNAIREGRKTQTRRVVKPQPGPAWPRTGGHTARFLMAHVKCPYGVPGDRLWVRETFNRTNPGGAEGVYYYRADKGFPWGDAYIGIEVWRPSIFMPRAASRLALEIVSVSVERLQDISQADAIAEGCRDWSGNMPDPGMSPKEAYRELWDSLNAKRGFGWETNPWVWCISFRLT